MPFFRASRSSAEPFLRSPERKARTLWACQQVALDTSATVAPFGRASNLATISDLLGAALVLVKIPSEQLPIVASLVTAILSLPVAYGAFRWGNNVGAKNAAEAAAKVSETSSAALAQIAGAGPPPPAAPLGDEPGSPA